MSQYRTPRRVLLFFVVCVAAVLAGAVPAVAIEVDDLVAQFKAGTHVFVEDGADPVNVESLEQSVSQARDLGYDLYIAVLGPESAEVDAVPVRKALGDATVAIWTPRGYQVATGDICTSALNQANQSAKANIDVSVPVDDYMAAFVGALAGEEPCDRSGGAPGWLRTLLLVIGVLAVLVALVALIQMIQDRSAAKRRHEEFTERRKVLADWADTLGEPLDELKGPVAKSGNKEFQDRFDDATNVAKNAKADIDAARDLPDLDRTEIRIARAQMSIRDLYEALPDVSRKS